MKNYKVIALRDFNDVLEREHRTKGKEFECTKERYEFLKSKGAVELAEVIKPVESKEKERIDENVEEKDLKKAPEKRKKKKVIKK